MQYIKNNISLLDWFYLMFELKQQYPYFILVQQSKLNILKEKQALNFIAVSLNPLLCLHPKKWLNADIQPCLNFISHVLWQMTKIMCAEVWIKIFIINNYRKVCWAIHCKGYRDRKSYFTYTVGIFGKFILNLEGLPIWAIFHMLLKWRIPW